MVILPRDNVAIPSFKTKDGPRKKLPYYVDVLVDNRIGSPHWHNYTQIWYTVSGEYYHTINGERRKQTAGSVALVFPFAIHSIDSLESDISNTRVISISIYNDLTETNEAPFMPLTFSLASFDNFLLHPFINLSGKEKELADEIVEKSLSEFNLKLNMNTRRISKNISEFFEICARSVNTEISTCKIVRTREASIVISEAANVLYKSNPQDTTLDSICNHVFMSKRSFTDKFKGVAGQTFGSYAKAVRLSKAIYALRYTQKAVAEISDECGYANISHFINECREAYGLPPKALKAQMISYDRLYGEYLYELDLKKNEWLEIWSDSDKYEYRMYALGLV